MFGARIVLPKKASGVTRNWISRRPVAVGMSPVESVPSRSAPAAVDSVRVGPQFQPNVVYSENVPARHLNFCVSEVGSCARNATRSLGSHCPFVTALSPNVTTPRPRKSPPGGAKRWSHWVRDWRCLGRSCQSPCSGADDAAAVSRMAPRTAAVTNVAPPPRYRSLTAVGSPILRRDHVTSSSNTWVRMRRRRAAALNPTRSGS